jgi:hypothetical protein
MLKALILYRLFINVVHSFVKTEELDKEYEAARAEKKSKEETKTNTDGKHRRRTAARK